MNAFSQIITEKKIKNIKPIVTVLGMTHLHNPEADEVNLNAGDIHSEKRQEELRELVTLLEKFKPTKIAIELPENDTLFAKTYYDYFLDGKLEEKIFDSDRRFLSSEVAQISYPLAKRMGHKQLFCIDAFTTFPIDSVISFALKNDMKSITDSLESFTLRAQKQLNEISKKPIIDILTFINSDYFSKNLNQNFYLNYMISIGKGEKYLGTNLVAEWYSRNLRIFTNLNRIIEPNDRVLIVFGAGHKDILEDLIKDRVDWEYYDINSILKK